MSTKVLLIAPETASGPVAEAIRQTLDLEVESVTTRRSGMACLRRREYALLIVDEGLISADQDGTDLLYQAAGAASVLEVNFVITGTERILRQVRAALARRVQDRQRASADVAANLRGELNGTLAGLLLETELALRDAAPAQQYKLQQVVRLASDLRERLSPSHAYPDL